MIKAPLSQRNTTPETSWTLLVLLPPPPSPGAKVTVNHAALSQDVADERGFRLMQCTTVLCRCLCSCNLSCNKQLLARGTCSNIQIEGVQQGSPLLRAACRGHTGSTAIAFHGALLASPQASRACSCQYISAKNSSYISLHQDAPVCTDRPAC